MYFGTSVLAKPIRHKTTYRKARESQVGIRYFISKSNILGFTVTAIDWILKR